MTVNLPPPLEEVDKLQVLLSPKASHRSREHAGPDAGMKVGSSLHWKHVRRILPLGSPMTSDMKSLKFKGQ